MCETSPSAPIAAPTDVRPSSSGTDAATSAPNASTRISSVIGTEISSARCSPLLTSWVIALSSEPLPASWKVTPGCRAASPSTKCCTSRGAAVGVVGIAAQRHDDERGSAARARQLGRAVGAIDRLHRRQAAGAGLERRDRVRGALRAARTDEHVLGRGALEARGGEASVGTGGFTGAGTGVRERAHAGTRAEPHARHDQREPERDGRLGAARRAPGRGVDEAGEHAGACRPGRPGRASRAARPAGCAVDEGVFCMGSETAFGGRRNRWGDRASGRQSTPVLDSGDNPTSRRSAHVARPVAPHVQRPKPPPSTAPGT